MEAEVAAQFGVEPGEHAPGERETRRKRPRGVRSRSLNAARETWKHQPDPLV